MPKTCKSNEGSNTLVANGGVIREQAALMSGIYSRKAGQYRMCLDTGIGFEVNGFSLQEAFTAYQVVGGVMAYQADDG